MRRSTALFAAVLASLVVTAPGQGRSATDDLSVLVHFVRDARATTTLSLANDVQFDLFTDGPAQTVTMKYSLPAGLTFGGDVPDQSENCTNGTPVVCTVALDASNSLNFSWSWPVIAARPGTYSIAVTVEGTRSDPNPANNAATFTFEVLVTGGGGGGAGQVALTSAKSTPAKPKAGKPVTFTSTVTVGGEAAKPSRVTCAATLGGKKKTGTALAATGKASCRYATNTGDKGKRLAGSMKVTAGGKSLTRRFAVKLG